MVGLGRVHPGGRIGRQTSRSSAATAVALLLLGGCAHYHAQPLDPAAGAAAFDARRLQGDARLQAFITASLPSQGSTSRVPRRQPPAWSLGTLTLAALYFHPDLDVARSKYAVARAAIATAGQVPNPSLNLSPLYDLTVAHPTPWTIGGIVDFVVETAGKRGARTEQAKALAEAARADIATAAWQVRGRVRAALLELWAADRRLRLARRRIALRRQLLDMLQQRVAAGQAPALEATRTRVEQAQAELDASNLEGNRAEARARLAAAIGVPAAALAGVRIDTRAFDTLPDLQGDQHALRREAMTGRTDVRASLAEYRAWEAALKRTIAGQYPNLQIGPEYNWGAIETDRIANQVGLPLTVELPVFNQNQGPIAEAVAERRAAAARFNALQAQIAGQVDKAAAARDRALHSLATAEALVAASRRGAAGVARAFAAGAADRPAFLGAELEQGAAEAGRIDALLAANQAAGAVEDALQRALYDPASWPRLPEQTPRASEPAL